MTRKNGINLRQHPAYQEREYQAARRDLKESPDTACTYCGRPADTLDHTPPLSRHEHVRGSGCCDTVPACRACNCAGGGRIGGRTNRIKAGIRREINASRDW